MGVLSLVTPYFLELDCLGARDLASFPRFPSFRTEHCYLALSVDYALPGKAGLLERAFVSPEESVTH